MGVHHSGSGFRAQLFVPDQEKNFDSFLVSLPPQQLTQRQIEINVRVAVLSLRCPDQFDADIDAPSGDVDELFGPVDGGVNVVKCP